MAELKNCLLPDDLRYHVEYNIWLRDNGDTAPLTQLRRTRQDMERSRTTLAENMNKLEAAGEELAEASSETHPVSALIATAYGIGGSEDQTPNVQ